MANVQTYPSVHVTGAVHHWVRLRETGDAPWYLGTAEVSPRVVLRQFYRDCPAPAAGGTLPFQKTYEGQAATVSVLLTRWSKFTEAALAWAGGSAGNLFATQGTEKAFPRPIRGPAGRRFTATDTGPNAPNRTVITPFDNTPERPPNLPLPSNALSNSSAGGSFLALKAEAGILGGAAGIGFGPEAEAAEPGEVPGTGTPPADPRQTGFVAGSESRWSRGSLVFGQRDFELWQVFDFSIFPTVRSPGLELGWYWPQVTLDVHDLVACGTQGKKLLLVFSAEPKFEQTPGGGGGGPTSPSGNTVPSAVLPPTPTGRQRGWVLWSNQADDFPAAVRVPQ